MRAQDVLYPTAFKDGDSKPWTAPPLPAAFSGARPLRQVFGRVDV
jgi:hypothetical protein